MLFPSLSSPDEVISATVVVYNLEGKQLKDFRVQGRGKTSVKISGSELNAGMYLYALLVDGKVVDTKRMILTKYVIVRRLSAAMLTK
jgi:trimeric autotransporter adhesin